MRFIFYTTENKLIKYQIGSKVSTTATE